MKFLVKSFSSSLVYILAFKQDINLLVYKLFILSYGEVKVVDGGFELGEEEYNQIN